MKLIKTNLFMGLVILAASLFANTSYLIAQNVGVNFINPPYKLTVAADNGGNGIVQIGDSPTGFYTDANSGGTLKTLNNSHLGFTTNNKTVSAMIISTTKNVGIGLGVNLPEYKLDLGGRLRLQHNTTLNQTAGFWLDGTVNDARSFIGTIDDNHTGIYGSAGAGWNIAMNVVNGNTGIGTTTPTSRLDINGTVRYRNSNPKLGSILVSSDVNGNAIWQSPSGFHASGIYDDTFDVPANTWTKFLFFNAAEYNAGLNYQPINSQFVAPYKGIYHFIGKTDFFFNDTETQGIALKMNRFGVISTITSKLQNYGGVTISGTQYNNEGSQSMGISTDVLLEAGDTIWLEVYHGIATHTNNYQQYHWFSGTLITRL